MICAYCQGHRRRHRSCHYGAVANTSHLSAALPRCRSPPAGSLAVRNGVPPRCCRRGGPATGPHPPTHTPHTHTASSREAKLCSAMVHCIPSKTLGQIPLDVWRGPAPFAVWAEPAWSPRGGWVNKLTIRHPTSELERVWPTGPPATPPAL